MESGLAKYALALAILGGLALNGYFIGQSIQRFRQEDRYITVKGFSEREVKANLAVWTLKTRITTNNLMEGSKEMEASKSKIIQFLKAKGINPENIQQVDLNVQDKLAYAYGGESHVGFRYVIENVLQVRTDEVEKVKQVSRMTDELLKMGVSVSGNQEYPPALQYLFTGLANIKPQMLSEASKNAKQAAVEFAKENQVDLGKLRKASQGLFSIIDRDGYISGQTGDPGFGGSGNNRDIMKKIRVVVSVEYGVK